jgi:L-rhamnose isomerase
MTHTKADFIKQNFAYAKEIYENYGVNIDKTVEIIAQIPISFNCWQGDDVTGFEPREYLGGGGILATGNYPGKARSVLELQQDAEVAMKLMPGTKKFNLHAIYGDYSNNNVPFTDRDDLNPEHFQIWVDWAKKNKIGLDFNATPFAHPKAVDGFTLSNKNKDIRDFWINHIKSSRKIAAWVGDSLKIPCINNIWIPDGMKDLPIDRFGYRALLKDSLDDIFSEKFTTPYLKDSIEGKLFGLGLESFTVGSHEFYSDYAVKNNLLVCLDMGHFHPTEHVGDKISSHLLFLDEILVHVSRGVRWDSDHIVIWNNDVQNVLHGIVRSNAVKRVHVALDFFDASINRIAAWIIGFRATQRAYLYALLEPTKILKEYEESGQYGKRLAFLEEIKSLPFSAVWDYYCWKQDVPCNFDWYKTVEKYEKDVLLLR